MNFDSCYLVYADQKPDFYTVCKYWETQGYDLKDPVTDKIHLWMPEGEEFYLVDNLDQIDNLEGTTVHLWSPSGVDLPISIRRRGNFYSEEYDFSGVVGHANIELVGLLVERQIQLMKSGLLIGVLFDRRDYVLEALSDW